MDEFLVLKSTKNLTLKGQYIAFLAQKEMLEIISSENNPLDNPRFVALAGLVCTPRSLRACGLR